MPRLAARLIRKLLWLWPDFQPDSAQTLSQTTPRLSARHFPDLSQTYSEATPRLLARLPRLQPDYCQTFNQIFQSLPLWRYSPYFADKSKSGSKSGNSRQNITSQSRILARNLAVSLAKSLGIVWLKICVVCLEAADSLVESLGIVWL